MALLCAVAATPAHARIGESQSLIERRLLAPGVGKLLAQGDVDESPRNRPASNPAGRAEAARRRASEPPHRKFQRLFPDGIRERAYWKSAQGHQLSTDDGWEVHVVFLADRSTLEAYQRVGDSLNEFEVMGLLAVQRGGSTWRRVEKEKAGGSALGYTYELEDGTLRARQQGNWLLIFSSRLDEYAEQRLHEEQALAELDREQLKRLQQKKAPESIAGF